ncbi:MAG: class I SAM-dependent methyltransferase [Candidatus Lokiarchaeota archaeon]|nr:class I SAM-dependent methyltransferase [Candidatus Lokiarchaeota archaeon]
MWDASFYNEKSIEQYKLGLNLLNELEFHENEKILDLGCGTGKLSIAMAERYPSCEIIGIDLDQNMINQAKMNLKKEKINNISFLTVDFLKYTPNFLFDVIFSNSVIHWIDDKKAVFQKIKEILNTNGRVGIQMPSSNNLSEITTLFIKPIENLNLQNYFEHWRFPMKRISQKKLKSIIDQLEFSNIKIIERDVGINFKNFEELLDFLQSAPLRPIISYIPDDLKKDYLESLLKILKEQGKNILNVTMKRIFIFLEN